MTDEKLISLAKEARLRAYVPYSCYRVGAALLCEDGKTYTGCNIENASYTPTVCAERCAIFKAVSEGERKFLAIAIVGGAGEEPDSGCTPCGVCRQVMAEFFDKDTRILLLSDSGIRTLTLGDLLPESFVCENLGRKK